ncbi:5-formyltetrahydrofolate cyclo-ligase [Methylobacterium oryzisoli]|uniref:5-formyltetrahydrofolate cyclo-ligase n=1 Tax=Methylobacterium oryzisoli TaxID=3385502 RepID=UPI003891509A
MSDTPSKSGAGSGQPSADADWPTVRDWRKTMRAKLVEQRIGISAEDRAARSSRISGVLGANLEPYSSKLIGFYWPFRGEYDPRSVLLSMQENGARLALPVIVERGQPLVFREWSPGSLMKQGVWNIPMPESGKPVSPDVLVVPLVGFDEQGYRLGYGGGFYDRTIAAMQTRPRTIGVGFELGRLTTIYPQPHDVPLEVIITER